eukprot:GDKI01000075.1.p2 GENE.GDKI01000075.1~~GDKI01000075.1.p2  ORF type:complete len:104 (-),score=17.15 GDKI01000075.1:179-490(-)
MLVASVRLSVRLFVCALMYIMPCTVVACYCVHFPAFFHPPQPLATICVCRFARLSACPCFFSVQSATGVLSVFPCSRTPHTGTRTHMYDVSVPGCQFFCVCVC